jgi:hypothetical protein
MYKGQLMNQNSIPLLQEARTLADIVAESQPHIYERVLLTQYTELLISECARLLEAHGNQLRQFNFPSNALTAESCAKILTEHFGLPKESPNEDRL